MKNLVSAVIVSMVVLMAATGLLAAPDRSVKPTLEGKRFIGTVVSVDEETKTLVVKTWWRDVVFDASNAHFAGEEGLKDMQPGDRVLIRYVEENGKRTARSVIKAARKFDMDRKGEPGAHVAQPAVGGGK